MNLAMDQIRAYIILIIDNFSWSCYIWFGNDPHGNHFKHCFLMLNVNENIKIYTHTFLLD